jgi:outer membrane protein assembly factor BamB
MRVFPRFLSVFGSFWLLNAPLVAQDATTPPIGGLPAVVPTMRDTLSWTTFKGDDQRTGTSLARVRLPLSLQWRYSSDAPARTYNSSPLVIGAPGRQRVVFGAGTNVYALDMQTGAQVWRSPNFSSNVVTPLTLLSGETGDLILAAQQSGRVAALRASDGGRAWETDTLASITTAGPLIVNTARGQRIICAISAGRLVALNLDGSIDPDWQVPLGRFGISPTSSMTLSSDGNLIFICGSDAKLYAIDVQKGVLAYTIQLAANSSVTPVVAGDQVITSNARRVAAFRASGGLSTWNFDPRGEIIGSPSVGTDVTGKPIIYFGTRNGVFYALDNTGAQVWKSEVGAGITGIPLVLPSMVVVGTSNGLLLALDPSNGTVIWRYRLKTERVLQQRRGGRRGGEGANGNNVNSGSQPRLWPISSAPTAIDGQLFVLGDNAALYSFSTQVLDAAPPRIIEPSLAVPDDQNKIAALLLSPENPQVVPGRGPIYFAAQMDDTGSGIDPASIKATLDDAAIPTTAIDFQSASGLLTITLLDPDKGGISFPDGLKNLNISARDYAGNELQYTVGFLIDNTAPAPSAQRNNTGRRGQDGEEDNQENAAPTENDGVGTGGGNGGRANNND